MSEEEVQAYIEKNLSKNRAAQILKQDLTWIQKHERFLLALVFTGAALWLGEHELRNIALKDRQVADAAGEQLAAQKSKDAQMAAQVLSTSNQYQALVESLTAQNAQIVAGMQNRTVVLRTQQATDRTMPLPDLGNRWTGLAKLGPGDLTATSAGIVVTDTGARQTVSQLEQVPVLTANLADTKKVADNRAEEVSKANDLIDDLHGEVDGLHTEIADADRACKTEIASVKAEGRKSKAKWFVKGLMVGAGVVTALALHF